MISSEPDTGVRWSGRQGEVRSGRRAITRWFEEQSSYRTYRGRGHELIETIVDKLAIHDEVGAMERLMGH